jgi:hypothetical protein
MKKLLLSTILLGAICMNVSAQSGTNSPYSQYGLGVLSDQSQGFNRGMNGLAYGLRDGNQVNYLNPASYSAVDSLTMVFDVGLSLQLTNFSEQGTKVNARNANFEYAVATFRLFPKVGLSAGLIPFTNIGYSYSLTENIGSSTTTAIQQHSGSGGLHQAFVGIGWNPFGGLSIGVNGSYLWGTYEKAATVSSNDSYINTMTRKYGATINNYKLDAGIQWEQKLGKQDALTIGATFGLGHKLNADPFVTITNTNSQTGVTQTTSYSIKDGLEIPMSFGAGLTYRHANRWLLGADFSLQKWGDVKFPEIDLTTQDYVLSNNVLRDRQKITVGGEWTPNAYDARNFLKRVSYRMGASYATPYYNIKGVEGPKELSVSIGLGLPIFNQWTNPRASQLNISAQWVHTSAKDLITENTFRINVGLTFNERWFQKWKVR